MNKELKLLAKFSLGALAVVSWFIGGVISSSTGIPRSKK